MKSIFIMFVLFFMAHSAFCQVSNIKKEVKNSASPVLVQRKAPKRILNIPVVYTFIGNGNWDVAANWDSNGIPPVDITPGSEIRINSFIVGAKCVLNVPYEIPNTTNTIKLIVYSGNKLEVPNLTVK
ncbi:MAG: hypothetical protein ABI366_06885 [Ginsengibacter sp.]